MKTFSNFIHGQCCYTTATADGVYWVDNIGYREWQESCPFHYGYLYDTCEYSVCDGFEDT